MTHHWPFDGGFPYKDTVTGESVSIIGINPLNTSDHLRFAGSSCIILGGFHDPCLAKRTTCTSGFTVSFWLNIEQSANLSQIFLGTSNNGSVIHGIFLYQAGSLLDQGKIIVELISGRVSRRVSLSVPQNEWYFMMITWNSKNLLRVYKNGVLANSTSTAEKVYQTLYNLVKLRALFSEYPRESFLYLESGGKYDEVMTWSRELNQKDAKRLFQIQLNKLSKISCITTVDSLNITWSQIEESFIPESKGFTLGVWRTKWNKREQLADRDLDNNQTHFLVKELESFSTYKVRLWAKTSEGAKRVGSFHCQTKEGVPTKILNLRITPVSSSSLFVRWSPPAQINGILQGYKLVVEGGGVLKEITVRDQEKYLVAGLKADTAYAVSVDSYTLAGSGPLPHYKTTRTKKVPHVKESPRSIHTSPLSWNTVRVTWPPMDKREEVASYDVQSCSVSECRMFSTENNSLSITGLHQWTSYKIRVRGKNTLYSGPWQTTQDQVKTLDLDECKTGQHICSALALCSNTAGSYECRCMSGLIGDGYSCEAVQTTSLDDFCKTELYKNISWAQTYKGYTAKSLCPVGYTGAARRKCFEVRGRAIWQKPDLADCVSKPFLELKTKVTLQGIDAEAAVSVASSLRTITNASRDERLSFGNLHTAIDILDSLGQEAGKNGTMNESKVKKIMEECVQVASNLLDGKVMKVWHDSSEESSSTGAMKLLSSLESLSLTTATVSNSKKPVVMETPNVVLNVQSFKRDSVLPIALHFPRDVTGRSLASGNSITMPSSEMWRNQSAALFSHIAFMYIKNIGQLLTQSSSSSAGSQGRGQNVNREKDINTLADADVMSLSINPKISGHFHEPVIITFIRNKTDSQLQPSCVFWNDTGEVGSWSAEGCHVSYTNSSHTVCHCYHLTSFTVLMQYTPTSYHVQESHVAALSLITYVGISISLIALFLALVTFASFAFLRSNRNFAHINLVFSLMLAELLFVVGIDRTDHQPGCFIIAVSLHYLFLVVFCWMATEGIILYLMLVKVFPASSNGPRKRVFFLCSWGIPVVPVCAALLSFREGYTTNKHCWLSIERGFIWSFLGPVVIICLVNITFLGLTFKAMTDRANQQPLRKPPKMRHWAKTCAVLTCLLGTTWLLGLFYVSKGSVIMAYLFNIFNVLQGLFIFVFHCLGDERIRSEYRRIICCRGTRRDYLRTKAVARSMNQKPSSTATTRTDRKARLSEDQKQSCSFDPVTVTKDSCGIVFADQQPVQNVDRYLDISPVSEKAEQGNTDSQLVTLIFESYEFPDVNSEVDDEDDEDFKSSDVFCEDISSSLLNVRQGKKKLDNYSIDPRSTNSPVVKERSKREWPLDRRCDSGMDCSPHLIHLKTKREKNQCNTELQTSPRISIHRRGRNHSFTEANNDRFEGEPLYLTENEPRLERSAYRNQRCYSTLQGYPASPSGSSTESSFPRIAVCESSKIGSEIDLENHPETTKFDKWVTSKQTNPQNDKERLNIKHPGNLNYP